MESNRVQEINNAIQKIEEHLNEISSLGWDIIYELSDEYGFDDYNEYNIPDDTNREIFNIARNCAMYMGWSEFNFGELKVK